MDAKEVIRWLKEKRMKRLEALADPKLKVWFVDEASMFAPDQFIVFRDIVKEFNPNMMVVLMGDFAQIPPVIRREIGPLDPRYCFSTSAWRELDVQVCHMHEYVRGANPDMAAKLLRVSAWDVYVHV